MDGIMAMTALQTKNIFGDDLIGLVMSSSSKVPIVLGVLLALLLFSLVSWGIILDKLLFFWKIKGTTKQFIEIFRKFNSLEEIYVATDTLRYSPLKNIYHTGFKEYRRLTGVENTRDLQETKLFRASTRNHLHREITGVIALEVMKMESKLNFLAITGSVTPFIGLLGTVWGIMNAFSEMGRGVGAVSLMTVAPAIAEALIATAAGLFAAIPAVIFFNYVLQQIKRHSVTMDQFAAEFLALLDS